MADVKLEVEMDVKGNEGTARKIGEVMGQGIKETIRRLGLGDIVKSVEATTGGSSDAIKTGMMAGLVAGGAITALKFIADALADFPVVAAIMKLLKMIIFILFLPLVPILKPILLILGILARLLLPWARTLSKATGPLASIESPLAGPMANVLAIIIKALWSFFNSLNAMNWKAQLADWNKMMEEIRKRISTMSEDWKRAWSQLILGLKVAWEDMKQVGKYVWKNIILPAFNYLKSIGIWIWDLIKTFFKGGIDVPSTVFNWFKSLFKGGIDVASTVWNWFKGLFHGTAGVAGGAGNTIASWWESLKDMVGLQGGGTVLKTGVAVVHKGETVSRGGNITVNINRPTVRNENDIKELVRQVSRELQKGLRGYVSYV